MTERGRRNGNGRGWLHRCCHCVVGVAAAVAIAMDAAFAQFDFIAWQNSMKRPKRQSDKRTNWQNDEAATEGAQICIQEHTPHTHTHSYSSQIEWERGKTHRDNMLMQINCLLTLFKFPIRHTWRGGAGGRRGRRLQREREKLCAMFAPPSF